jgi:hypothetical protein
MASIAVNTVTSFSIKKRLRLFPFPQVSDDLKEVTPIICFVPLFMEQDMIEYTIVTPAGINVGIKPLIGDDFMVVLTEISDMPVLNVEECIDGSNGNITFIFTYSEE